MTPEAVVLHFIDDLDSKLNQLRATREASPGIVFHRGMGRYVYLPPLQDREMLEEEPTGATEPEPAQEVADLEMQAPLFTTGGGDRR
jgi:hypothetical protein